MIEYGICSSGTASGVTGKFSNISGEVSWKMAHERERVSDLSAAEKSLSLIVNKKTPEGVYAGCVGTRKNYRFGNGKLSSVCNKCVQERRRCSVKD